MDFIIAKLAFFTTALGFFTTELTEE